MSVAFVPGSFASQSFGNSTAAESVAFAQNVAAGSLLEVTVAQFAAGVTLTVTDSLGQTYTQAGGYISISSTKISKWYFANTTGGACTVTVTPSASTYLAIAVAEYTGVLAVSPLNATSAGATGESANPTTGSVAVANPGDLVTGGYAQGTNNLASSTVASPFAVRAALLSGGTEMGLGTADDTNAAGSEGATFTTSPSVQWAGLAASYKAAAGVSRIYVAEIRSGPPLRGAPWAAQLPVQPTILQAPPPPGPSPSFIIAPEIRGGPPLRGAPWLQQLPVQPVILQAPPGTLPPGFVPQVYAREITSGPPMRGAPFAGRVASELQDLVQAPPLPLPVGQSIPAPEIVHGPPMMGAPWAGILPITPAVMSPSTAPPAPPSPPSPRPGQLAPLLPRDPVQDPRLRRFTEMLSAIVNSLVGKGQLLQSSPTSWAIAAGAFEVARAPGPADDSTAGAFAGSLWINTLSGGVYICQSAAAGSAVWVLIGGGGSSGLTGHFPS